MAKYDMKKLEIDLAFAAVAAKDAAALVTDGGTCNFDSAVLVLPGANQEKVMVAIKAAGLSGFKLSGRFWKGCFSLGAPESGEGGRRTCQAEAMEKSLKAAGWQTRMYYQMD